MQQHPRYQLLAVGLFAVTLGGLMFHRRRYALLLAVESVVVVVAICGVKAYAADAAGPEMPTLIEQFSADRRSLDGIYMIPFSASHMDRFERFYGDELKTLAAMDFDHLSNADKLDYLLLQNTLRGELHQLELQRKQTVEMMPPLPFAPSIDKMMDQKRLMQRPNAEATAAALTALIRGIEAAERDFDPARSAGKTKVNPVTVNRAVAATRRLAASLKDWHEQYSGYDPELTWWVDGPYQQAAKALDGYASFVKEKLIGIAPDDKTTIIGDPVGRDALMHELAADMIPYTPEELVAIAQTEYDWCMREMLRASHEMGYGDDWHAAVEKVKTMHVAPGEQPELIRKLVVGGIDFVKKNDLVTVPPMAEETWRMIMMTPERQLVNPFFTGGDEISVSYPTNTMTFDQREMSMRGNNIPFARATAFHEMIPGHFLQFYMAARYHPYREPFSTPFWYEGNSLWWEMLFWDRGFDRTPEERVGALVWRMHRSARVIFAMNFHLGKWTPQQCVQSLIDNVGFEPDNATAEVRRSFDGSVGPLYQSAYLMGGLQFRALHKEMVGSGKMTEREFHDAVLHENAMPIALLRAYMEKEQLTRDFVPQWKFYGDHPTHP